MKDYKTFLITEGVYDPGIFKAYFLAGGPGSGKTFVTANAFAGTGLKLVNSDAVFERYLKQAGLSMKMPESEAEIRDEIRARAKAKTSGKLDLYIKGRLGLVIDGTGRDFELISKSASLRYLFVSIEPIKEYLTIGASFSNSFNCVLIISKTSCLSFGFSVSASSNTPGA